MVTAVEHSSVTHRAGIRKGFVILRVNERGMSRYILPTIP